MFTQAQEKAYNDALAQSNVTSANGFTGDVRVFDLTSLELGDELLIDFENDKVLKQKLGTRLDPTTGEEVDNIAEYVILVTKKNKIVNFYPSAFTKTRRVYEADGTATSIFAKNDGTAVDFYKQFQGQGVQAAMEAMKGKTIKVTNSKSIKTKAFGQDKLVDTNILTIDLV